MEYHIRKNIAVPMRDGVILYADLYMPAAEGAFPAVIMRTPYNKDKFDQEWLYSNPELWMKEGYCLLIQDVRGCCRSEGILLSTGESEVEDGYDTVEWVAAQPWCDKNVGMYGLSYFGWTQYAAAEGRPPHLKAICPYMNASLLPFSVNEYKAIGGLHMYWLYGQALSRLDFLDMDEARREQVRSALTDNMECLDELLFPLPLKDTKAAHVEGVPLLKDYIELVEGAEKKEFWDRGHHPVKIGQMTTPMLHLTGWFDMAKDGTIGQYLAGKSNPGVGDKQKLVIGPWFHGGALTDRIDDLYFGPQASGKAMEMDKMMVRWMDRWLKQEKNDQENEPAVLYFMLGSNTWKRSSVFPPENTACRTWYLDGDGGQKGKGSLTTPIPPTDGVCKYVYDPQTPVRSDFKDRQGRQLTADLGELEVREDILSFTSAPLEEGIPVTGEVKLTLYVSTTAVDTDFICRLTDVWPQGRVLGYTWGMCRTRFSDKGFEPKLLTPGEKLRLEISLGFISAYFEKGHRIGLEIMSSFYPAVNRNTNSGQPSGSAAQCSRATQQIFFGAASPSALSLPVES